MRYAFSPLAKIAVPHSGLDPGYPLIAGDSCFRRNEEKGSRNEEKGDRYKET
jgi:hypothetical protein